MVDGWKYRDEREMEMLAWQTAHLINIHTKRKITVENLLKKKGQVTRGATTAERTKQTLEELEAEMTI